MKAITQNKLKLNGEVSALKTRTCLSREPLAGIVKDRLLKTSG
jgi:hypothetical protein